jgi:hypothetical protein
MSRTVRCWGAEDMQILGNVVQLVPVNVVDDLTRLGPSDSAMLPLLTVVPFCPRLPSSLSIKCLTVSAVCFFGACASRFGWSQFRIRGDFVTSPHVLPWRKTVNFLRVGVERIAMSMPHLVVPHTHITSGNWSFAVEALTPNNLAAPCVINRAVFFHALVVHQAKTVGGMFAATSSNAAKIHSKTPEVMLSRILSRYKALGNSWAAPVVRWIGERIQRAVDPT